MTTKLDEIFERNVRRRITELGITQRELARRLDVAEGNVSVLLNAKYSHTCETVERVAEALHTTALYLLTEVEPENSEPVAELSA